MIDLIYIYRSENCFVFIPAVGDREGNLVLNGK